MRIRAGWRARSTERRADAGGAVEHHNGDAVVLTEESDGVLGGVGDALDVGAHGGADIEQEDDVEGHLFGGEVADFTDLAVVAEDEVLAIECGDGAVVAVHCLDIDAHERDVALEDDIGLHGLLGGGEDGGGQEHGQGGDAKH